MHRCWILTFIKICIEIKINWKWFTKEDNRMLPCQDTFLYYRECLENPSQPHLSRLCSCPNNIDGCYFHKAFPGGQSLGVRKENAPAVWITPACQHVAGEDCASSWWTSWHKLSILMWIRTLFLTAKWQISCWILIAICISVIFGHRSSCSSLIEWCPPNSSGLLFFLDLHVILNMSCCREDTDCLLSWGFSSASGRSHWLDLQKHGGKQPDRKRGEGKSSTVTLQPERCILLQG